MSCQPVSNLPQWSNCEIVLFCTCLQIFFGAFVSQRLQCQERRLDLEGEMENPEDETRVRFLRGNDPSPAELQNKLEEVRTIGRPFTEP